VGRGVWRLVEPVRIEIAGHAVKRVPARRFANLGETVRAEVDTMHFSVFELAEEIGELQSDEIDTTTLEVDYFAKIAEPLACIVLPAVVLFFAVGGPPFPGPAQTLLASGVLAVAYVLATGVSASLGYGGTISPRIAGWGPILFFTILAAYFGQRLWRRL
jgi:lipopolysaccharide export LptBFGC system permease protein LptF